MRIIVALINLSESCCELLSTLMHKSIMNAMHTIQYTTEKKPKEIFNLDARKSFNILIHFEKYN